MKSMFFLLQVQTATDSLATGADKVTLWDLALRGGIFMIPLLLMSVAAVYIYVERIQRIKRASADPATLFNQVKNAVLEANIEKAKTLCAQADTPIARMLGKGVAKIGTDLKSIEASIENVGKTEIYKLEEGLSVLATISGAGPMVGFLGTVTGMIQAFIAIAQHEGSVSPKLLSSGIYEAMITTAAGLIVGIISYIGYNHLVARVQKVVHKMELTIIEFIELLEKPLNSR